MTKRQLAFAVSCIAILLVSGCVSAPPLSAPTFSPAPSEEPTTTPTPQVADTVRLSAEQIELLQGETELATAPLSDTAESVATLSDHFGAPEVENFVPDPDNYCARAQTIYRWGENLQLTAPVDDFSWPSAYDVRIFGPSLGTVEHPDVRLEAAGRVAVGDDVSDLVAASPDMMETYEGTDGVTGGLFILQRGFSSYTVDPNAIWGVAAVTENNLVTILGSPMPIRSSIDC